MWEEVKQEENERRGRTTRERSRLTGRCPGTEAHTSQGWGWGCLQHVSPTTLWTAFYIITYRKYRHVFHTYSDI